MAWGGAPPVGVVGPPVLLLLLKADDLDPHPPSWALAPGGSPGVLAQLHLPATIRGCNAADGN